MNLSEIFEEAKSINFLYGPGTGEFVKLFEESEGDVFYIGFNLIVDGSSKEKEFLRPCLDNLKYFLENKDPESVVPFVNEFEYIFDEVFDFSLKGYTKEQVGVIALLAIKHFVPTYNDVCFCGFLEEEHKGFDKSYYYDIYSLLLSMSGKYRSIYIINSNFNFTDFFNGKVRGFEKELPNEFFLTELGWLSKEELEYNRLSLKLLDFIHRLKKDFRSNYFNGDSYKDPLEIEKKINDFLCDNNLV